jgi:hypothetical protein
VRANFDVNADDRFAKMAEGIKAGVAEFEAKLVFAPGVKTAVAFVAGGIIRTLALFVDVNFRMNFKLDHKLPRSRRGTMDATMARVEGLNPRDLRRA